MLYLLYIDLACGGHWFLSFAFPVCGGAFILTGLYNVLIEFLLNLNFNLHEGFIWSFYPLAGCVIIGAMLIVIGCSSQLRESLHKKFFI